MMKSEKDIQNLILEYLSLKNIFHYRQNSGAMVTQNKNGKGFYRFASINGIPDIMAFKDGKTYGIEVKAPKGRQSDTQKEFEKNFTEAGGIYILAHDVEDVMDYL